MAILRTLIDAPLFKLAGKKEFLIEDLSIVSTSLQIGFEARQSTTPLSLFSQMIDQSEPEIYFAVLFTPILLRVSQQLMISEVASALLNVIDCEQPCRPLYFLALSHTYEQSCIEYLIAPFCVAISQIFTRKPYRPSSNCSDRSSWQKSPKILAPRPSSLYDQKTNDPTTSVS